MSPHRVFSNGRIYTADAAGSWAEAVGVEQGRIRAIGSRGAVRAAMRPDAHEIDLGGRTVLPGLIDAHNHFLATAEALASLDVGWPRVGSIEELVAVVAAAAAGAPAGRWIRAVGLNHAKFPDGRLPTRWDLDRATRDHPVVVQHVSGHFALVNSAALAARGLGERTPDPKGGRFVRDGEGRLTGLCLDAAMGLVRPVAVDIGSHGPNFHTEAPLEEMLADLDRAGRAYLAAGLTTVCDPQVTRRELTVYREARRQDRLHVRTVCMPLSSQLRELRAIGLAGPFGDDRLAIGGMKFYADGSLIGGTAAFSAPEAEGPAPGGVTYWQPEELGAMIAEAHAGGWQVGVHAQGDRAIGAALDAIDSAMRTAPRPDPRHRIEHAGLPTQAQLERMAGLGVITVNQPLYLRDSGDEFLRRLGERAHRLQPLRDELILGIRVVLSSDAFVASHRPLETIAAAIRRRTQRGEPIGAAQALKLEEAVRAYTIEAARATFMEDRVGSLEPGKLADLVVVDGDLFAAPPERLADLPVWMTVVGGEVVWGAASPLSARALRTGGPASGGTPRP
ncbi:MAG: amidohydrolase [Candidatus Rokubacteria bacterium]|nr:amidohydrolase [Candidatus Rokubacteria bacterium]